MPTREEIEAEQSPLDLFPVIDERLIAYLQGEFPIRPATADSTERDDVYAGGQFSVIQKMIEGRDYQLDQARKRSGTPAFSPQAADEEEPDEE